MPWRTEARRQREQTEWFRAGLTQGIRRQEESMIATIGKTFTFDAAHQLPLHDGKCRHLHGHTYRVEVTVKGDTISTGSKSGMVVDFGDIKTVWKDHIEPLVDHRFLNDSLPVSHTTAELIAGWMLMMFRQHLTGPAHFLEMTVTVWETVDSWARAT